MHRGVFVQIKDKRVGLGRALDAQELLSSLKRGQPHRAMEAVIIIKLTAPSIHDDRNLVE